VLLTKVQYQAEIDALTERQEASWRDGLRKYVQMAACGLGICVEIDALDRLAREAKTPEEHDRNARKASAARAERQLNWDMVAREIEQIEIAKKVLEKQRDGLL
jgi:hypothetical protein